MEELFVKMLKSEFETGNHDTAEDALDAINKRMLDLLSDSKKREKMVNVMGTKIWNSVQSKQNMTRTFMELGNDHAQSGSVCTTI